MNTRRALRTTLLIGAMAWSATVQAQVIIESGTVRKNTATVTTPPSVDNGLANGDVKHAGAPSVGNGIANGVVKAPGSPSVDNGVANGSSKSSTIQQ